MSKLVTFSCKEIIFPSGRVDFLFALGSFGLSTQSEQYSPTPLSASSLLKKMYISIACVWIPISQPMLFQKGRFSFCFSDGPFRVYQLFFSPLLGVSSWPSYDLLVLGMGSTLSCQGLSYWICDCFFALFAFFAKSSVFKTFQSSCAALCIGSLRQLPNFTFFFFSLLTFVTISPLCWTALDVPTV